MSWQQQSGPLFALHPKNKLSPNAQKRVHPDGLYKALQLRNISILISVEPLEPPRHTEKVMPWLGDRMIKNE